METSLQERERVITTLLRDFECNNMILFVGAAATKSDLSQELCRLPWSCVITSCRDEDFGSLFVNESRRAQEFVDSKDMPIKIFDRG